MKPTLLFTVPFPANTGFAWDFIERLYGRIADRLAAKGVRTLVAYPQMKEPPRTLQASSAIPIELDTSMATWDARTRMLAFVRRENVRVIYFTDRPLWSAWYPVLRMAGVQRIVVHDHSSGTRRIPTGLKRAVKQAVVNLPGLTADVMVAVSEFVARRDSEAMCLPREKIRVIWNGIDPIAAEAEQNATDIRRLLNVSTDTVVVGCACRATLEKGVHVLLNAFAELSARSALPCVLAYIGDGPQMQNLSALRASLSCADRIHLLGYLPDASTLLRTADICAVPSVWQDAFPLAVLEMMARGRAVLGTRVGGVPEMIEDGVSGILVPPDDVAAFANALEKLVSGSALRSTLGRAARERVLRIFTAERQMSQMLETFETVFQQQSN